VADGQPRGRVVAEAAKILEVYRHQAVGLAAIWLAAVRVPAVATDQTCPAERGQEAQGLALAT
jgi:hypothetical protein